MWFNTEPKFSQTRQNTKMIFQDFVRNLYFFFFFYGTIIPAALTRHPWNQGHFSTTVKDIENSNDCNLKHLKGDTRSQVIKSLIYDLPGCRR